MLAKLNLLGLLVCVVVATFSFLATRPEGLQLAALKEIRGGQFFECVVCDDDDFCKAKDQCVGKTWYDYTGVEMPSVVESPTGAYSGTTGNEQVCYERYNCALGCVNCGNQPAGELKVNTECWLSEDGCGS